MNFESLLLFAFLLWGNLFCPNCRVRHSLIKHEPLGFQRKVRNPCVSLALWASSSVPLRWATAEVPAGPPVQPSSTLPPVRPCLRALLEPATRLCSPPFRVSLLPSPSVATVPKPDCVLFCCVLVWFWFLLCGFLDTLYYMSHEAGGEEPGQPQNLAERILFVVVNFPPVSPCVGSLLGTFKLFTPSHPWKAHKCLQIYLLKASMSLNIELPHN